MHIPKLQQALALAKTAPANVGLTVSKVPQLSGKLASIDPEGCNKFNSEMQSFVTDLIAQLSQALTEAQVMVDEA